MASAETTKPRDTHGATAVNLFQRKKQSRKQKKAAGKTSSAGAKKS